MKSLSYPNKHRPPSGKGDLEAIIRHGFYTTRWGKRRRYQWGRTFCSTSGTPYYRLQHRRATFDEVAALSVEGLNKSRSLESNASPGTRSIAGWKEPSSGVVASTVEGQRDLPSELQADEIKTIVGGRQQPIWVFAVIEVWSRLWPSTVVGKRSYQNTLSLFQDLSRRMNLEPIPLVVTDGFGFYEKVIGRVFGPGCL